MSIGKVVVVLALFAATGATYAHGDGGHGDKPGAAVKKEQTSWGIAGDPGAAKRTIEIRMLDKMRFEPATIRVKQGETVKLAMTNTGAVLHELVLGTPQELEAHAAMMRKFPNMEHDEPYMAHVAPGMTGGIVWNFNRAGEFDFACLVAGHYEAGMVGKITVEPR
jgi:uncharacterized cupredoxin-like copper-binding protein